MYENVIAYQIKILIIYSNAGLPKADFDLVKNQIATFENKFLLPLATYSRNAQPDENMLEEHDRLDAQSDVKLDLVLAFNIHSGNPYEDAYEIFRNKIIMNFPIEAEKTRVAVLVFDNVSMWSFIPGRKTKKIARLVLNSDGTGDFISEDVADTLTQAPFNDSETYEEFTDKINLMFEKGIGGKPRDAKRAAVIVHGKYPVIRNKQRALAAKKRFKQLNVKAIHISTQEMSFPHNIPSTDLIVFNITKHFRKFVNYSSPSNRYGIMFIIKLGFSVQRRLMIFAV